MERILQVLPYMQTGGTETFIMNLYKNIDRNKIQFDFIVHSQQKAHYDDEIKKLGGNIYYFSFKDDKNLFKYVKELNSFFKKHKEYRIIHGNMPSIGFLYLYLAKKNGIRFRIAHSHTSSYNQNIKGILKHFSSKLMKFESTVNFACSNLAGKYMFKNKEFEVIHNAIDLSRFNYNEKVSNKNKRELGLDDKIVIGHVGRFSKEKNHIFLLDVLQELIKINDKYIMIFIGDGELKKQIISEVKRRNLYNNVIFVEPTDKIEYYYQLMDIFVMPSLFEGLSISSIEAQQMKIPSIVSPEIPSEAILTNYIKQVPLKKEYWVHEITKMNINNRTELDNFEVQKNYDMQLVAKEMENRYLNYVGKGE